MIHVEDLIEASILCAKNPLANNQIFILTDGEVYSTSQIMELIYLTLGKKMPTLYLPYGILKWMAKSGDLLQCILKRNIPLNSVALNSLLGSANYSSEKIRSQLKFSSKHTLYSSMNQMIK